MVERGAKFVAIDGFAIIFRAYHAYPATLVSTDGVQVNAVYGFTSMLLSVLAEYNPKYIVCTLDSPGPTFRHDKYPEYKAHRKPTDQELLDQFPLAEEVLAAFNIPIIKRSGFEADDILGDLAERARRGKWSEYNLDFLIVSGDRDLLQLVGDNVRVCLPVGSFKTLTVYDEQETFKKMEVYPNQIVDYKSLVGDPSDNIPGVKGIGVKTVTALLNQYGTVEKIYNNLDKIPKRQAKLLADGIEQMELSKELATILTDTGMEVALEDSIMTDFSREEVLDLFREYGFRSLINKIPTQVQPVAQVAGQMGLFESPLDEVDHSSDSENAELGVIDIPPGGISKWFAELSDSGNQSVYMYFTESEVGTDNSQLEFGDFLEAANPLYGTLHCMVVDKGGQLSDVVRIGVSRETSPILTHRFIYRSPCETYFYNWEGFVECLSDSLSESVRINDNIFDIILASHILRSNLKDVSFRGLVYSYLGKDLLSEPTEVDFVQHVHTFIELSRVINVEFDEVQLSYYSEKFQNSIMSSEGRIPISVDFAELFYKYEIRLSSILAQMQTRGVLMDLDRLKLLDDELKERITTTEAAVFKAVGHEFNIASPKQLGEVLFDELGLPQGRGKSGRSTREEVLGKLQGLHPVVLHILEYRELTKLHGTYILPMYAIGHSINEKYSSIHTNYLQTGASSGRLSSKDPNMQNLPAKGDWAPRVKELFVAREGYKFVSMDYSQIELRILADMSGDPVLTKDFVMDKDIHLGTAARILSKPLSKVTDKDRRLGKTINFGIVYGQTKFGLSSMLDVPIDQADEYIKEYFENYKGVDAYLKGVASRVRDVGYVQTGLGRRRYISGLDSSNIHVQNAAVREAVNMPIQGTAADILKIAMVNVADYLLEKGLNEDVHMLLQVHDELIFEVKEDVVESVVPNLLEIFRNVVKLSVPLVVHTSVGDSLADLK